MPPACLLYLSRLTLCIDNQCHFWSPVISIMAESILLAVFRMTTFISGSIMVLVAATLSSLLRLPFLLYASR